MNNMGKKLAIRGHRTRGAEVIKALEELGGKNSLYLEGICIEYYYYIDDRGYITVIHTNEVEKINNKDLRTLTLEEYLVTLKQTEQINDNTQRQLSVDIETAKKWYKTNNETLKQLALSLFTEKELTKLELPTSWEEFCVQNSNRNSEYYINNRSEIKKCNNEYRDIESDTNLLETKEDTEAILALIQLKRLRDAWWKTLNYEPNWLDYEEKYCIVVCNDKITLETRSFCNAFLAFPTEKYRNRFFEHFQYLILKAKPFLS